MKEKLFRSQKIHSSFHFVEKKYFLTSIYYNCGISLGKFSPPKICLKMSKLTALLR